MTLGGTDKRLHDDDMVYTDTSTGNGFYGVKLRNIYLREGNSGTSAVSSVPTKKVVSLGIPPEQLNRGQFIVDSGTTDTYFARSFSPYFKKVFKDLAGFDYGHSKVKLTKEELESMPTILFQLKGDEAMNTAVQSNKQGKQVVGLANQVDPQNPHDILVAMAPSHYMGKFIFLNIILMHQSFTCSHLFLVSLLASIIDFLLTPNIRFVRRQNTTPIMKSTLRDFTWKKEVVAFSVQTP